MHTGGLIYDSDLSSGRAHYSEIDKESLLFYEKNPDDYIVIEDTTKQLGIKVNTVIPRSKMYLRVSFIQKVTWILVAVLIAIIFPLPFIQQTNGIFNPEVAE